MSVAAAGVLPHVLTTAMLLVALGLAAGLQATSPTADLVAVHDGARPLISSDVISLAIREARKYGAVSVAAPIVETLKRVDEAQRVVGSVDRSGLWTMQTPQVFRASLLLEAQGAAAEKVVTQAHLISGFDGLTDQRTPSPRRDAERLMSLARKKTGLHDFGPDPIEEALDHLLRAYREEADLNLFGRVSTRWDTLRLLKNLLILRDRERQDPSILTRPVEAPIFVMGPVAVK